MKKKVTAVQEVKSGPVSMTNLPAPLTTEEPLPKVYTEAELALLTEASVVLGYDAGMSTLTFRQTLKEMGMKIIKPSTIPAYKTQAIEKATKVTMKERFGANWKSRFGNPRFCIVPLAEYKGIIPSDILQQAVQIKRKCAGVRFEVEYLALGESRDPDPFLLARVKSQRLYISVWEEPDFVPEFVDPDDE